MTENIERSAGSNPLDFCPSCQRRITDQDDNGMENDDGQRWCRNHAAAAGVLNPDLAALLAEEEEIERHVWGEADHVTPSEQYQMLRDFAGDEIATEVMYGEGEES